MHLLHVVRPQLERVLDEDVLHVEHVHVLQDDLQLLRVAVARLEDDPLDVDLPHGLEVHGEVGGVDLRQVEGDVQLAAVLQVYGLDLVALGVDSTGNFL